MQVSANSFPRVDSSLRYYSGVLHDSLLEFAQRLRAFIYEFADQVKWLGQCMRLHHEPRKAPKHNNIHVCTKLETCKLHAVASPESVSPPTTKRVRAASLSQPRPTRARHSQPDPARARHQATQPNIRPASQPPSQPKPAGQPANQPTARVSRSQPASQPVS